MDHWLLKIPKPLRLKLFGKRYFWALAREFEQAENGGKRIRIASEWQRLAAEGNSDAKLMASLILPLSSSLEGWGYKDEPRDAIDWIRKHAEDGDPDFQVLLAGMYAEGRGLLRDLGRATTWYRRAAAEGDPEALGTLAEAYALGWGVTQDYTEAARYLQLVEEAGGCHPWLASIMHFGGLGIPRDCDAARKCYRNTLEIEFEKDQKAIGILYPADPTLPGGSPKDDAELVAWYLRDANRDHDAAQFKLAVRYALGKGVPHDDVEAVKWFARSADARFWRAQFHLGLAFALGIVAEEDLIEAHKWFNIAAMRSEHPNLAWIGRDCVSQRLTDRQLSIAQRRASQWVLRHGSS